MPRLGAKYNGDLHIVVGVEIPKKLSKEQKELIEKLGETMGVGKNNKSQKKNIFDKMFN